MTIFLKFKSLHVFFFFFYEYFHYSFHKDEGCFKLITCHNFSFVACVEQRNKHFNVCKMFLMIVQSENVLNIDELSDLRRGLSYKIQANSRVNDERI